MELPGLYFTKALSHKQKVLRLYKRALRECNNWFYPESLEASYHKCVMRQRFEINRNESDTRKSRKMLLDGVKELWHKRHFQPLVYPWDPTHAGADRNKPPPDQVLDEFWTHQDRAQYPYYFERRERRKRELMDHWEKFEADWKRADAK